MNKTTYAIAAGIIIVILMYGFRFQTVSDAKGIFLNRWTGAIYVMNGQYIGQVGNKR